MDCENPENSVILLSPKTVDFRRILQSLHLYYLCPVKLYDCQRERSEKIVKISRVIAWMVVTISNYCIVKIVLISYISLKLSSVSKA